MAHGVRLKDEATGAIISFLRNSATTPRTYSLPNANGTIGLVGRDIPFVTPEQYGAIGDGSTNDYVAIQAAVDSGLPVFFGKKNYRTSSTINLPNNSKIFGSGEGSIVSITANINLFNLTGTYVSIENLTMAGNSTGDSQVGINGTGVLFTTLIYGCRISNCSFQNFSYCGIVSINNAGASNTQHEGGFWIENSKFQNCTNGIFFQDRCEYNTIVNCVILQCGSGVRFTGGNNTIIGGSVTDCTTQAFRLDTGTNPGKNVIDGVKINHNAIAFTGITATNGTIVSNCSILASVAINLTNCEGWKFVNNDMSAMAITTTNSTGIEFLFNRFISTTSLTVVSGVRPRFFGNTSGPTGTINTLERPSANSSLASPTALGANTDNYAPTGIADIATLRISASSAVDLTGINSGVTMVEGRELWLINIGTNTITLKNDVTSTAANRFLLNADFSLASNMSCLLRYDATSARWRKVY